MRSDEVSQIAPMEMRLPAIKETGKAQLMPNGAVWVGPQLHGQATELMDERGVVWSVCSRLDGTRSPETLIAEVTALHSDTDASEVSEIIDFLIASGWVKDMAAHAPAELSTRELARYQRGIEFLDAINVSGGTDGYRLQARLKACRVAVLGLGGVGSAVATNLAASGVGQIHCVDHDTVELSNLNRQLLFTEADVGRGKIAAGVAHLRSRNSDVVITGTDTYLDGPQAIADVASGCDALVMCADQPSESIRFWANEAAYATGVPWLTASYSGPKFSLSCFIPGRTACCWCLAEGLAEQRARKGLNPVAVQASTVTVNAVSASSAQLAGHYLATETIRLLVGLPVQTAGRELHRYLTDYDEQYYLDAEARPDCPVRCADVR
ncbi:MAG: ThiF family adenylyltransferase [Streptosporangiaceae bacterium]